MTTERVKQYIEENKVCSEILFHDWTDFLELLFTEGGHIEAILWFEHVLISEQKNSLGAGGYRDKNNPNYMYAETYIYQEKMEDKTLAEVKEHIQSILSDHPNRTLVPSFFWLINIVQ